MRQLLTRQSLKQASIIISAKCITINTSGGTITHKNIDAYSKILDKYLKIIALLTSWSFLDDIKVSKPMCVSSYMKHNGLFVAL